MAFADTSTYFDTGDGSIIGGFEEKTCENFFEFSAASAEEIDNSFGTNGRTVFGFYNGIGSDEPYAIEIQDDHLFVHIKRALFISLKVNFVAEGVCSAHS